MEVVACVDVIYRLISAIYILLLQGCVTEITSLRHPWQIRLLFIKIRAAVMILLRVHMYKVISFEYRDIVYCAMYYCAMLWIYMSPIELQLDPSLKHLIKYTYCWTIKLVHRTACLLHSALYCYADTGHLESNIFHSFNSSHAWVAHAKHEIQNIGPPLYIWKVLPLLGQFCATKCSSKLTPNRNTVCN